MSVPHNHEHMVGLYALWYNFVRIHKTLRTSPAMAARIETRLWSMEDVVALIDARQTRTTGNTLIGRLLINLRGPTHSGFSLLFRLAAREADRVDNISNVVDWPRNVKR
jgi:hypothetical protein